MIFVITRHPALLDYLKEIGFADEKTVVLPHATAEQIKGHRVIGVLPHSLSCLCSTFTEIPLNIPQELRGTELNIEQIRQFAGSPATYMVHKIP